MTLCAGGDHGYNRSIFLYRVPKGSIGEWTDPGIEGPDIGFRESGHTGVLLISLRYGGEKGTHACKLCEKRDIPQHQNQVLRKGGETASGFDTT